MQGKYIVIEGHDGTGKSTQVQLLRAALAKKGIESVEFHEPQGTPIADEIRTIIKNSNLARDPETNLLLFTAARHEIWKQAEEALARGVWVVSSRNYFSTLAYQGFGEGVDRNVITSLTRQFTGDRYMKPDIALILSLDSHEERHSRLHKRGESPNEDSFESRDQQFQQAVQTGYLEIAKEYNLPVIPADKPIDEISKMIEALVFVD